MEFRNESVDDFLTIFNQYRKEIAGFPGCTELSLLRDFDRPNVFFTFSLWDTEEALNAYRGSELFAIVWPQTKKLFEIPARAWSLQEKS